MKIEVIHDLAWILGFSRSNLLLPRKNQIKHPVKCAIMAPNFTNRLLMD